MLVECLVFLEGVEICWVIVFGMGVILFVMIVLCSVGDCVVVVSVLFGFCWYICFIILFCYGVEMEFVDGVDFDVWKKVLFKLMCLVLIESLFNLLFEVVDIEVVVKFVYVVGVLLVVDNVFVMLIL